jgi:hypothetical protein
MKTEQPFVNSARFAKCGLPLCLVLFALGFCFSGCGNGKTAANSTPDHTGTYALVSIDGKTLPCTPPHEGGAPEVQSGSLTLNADGTHSSSITFRVPPDKTGTREVKGTYTRDGVTLNMKWEGAGTTTAKLEGSNLTMINEGIAFAYRK